jgi:translation initiation factor 1
MRRREFKGSGQGTVRSWGVPRLVYSSGNGKTCPRCGWPEADCRCSSSAGAGEAVPDRIVAKLRVERVGRGGKTVTVIDGLPRNKAFVTELAQELKRACGSGGKAGDGAVELQGDLKERVRELLVRRGFVVKG